MTSGTMGPRPFQRGREELELKFRVTDPATAERLIAADRLGVFVAGPAARPAHIEDRYMDTSDGALGRAGYAVRLRQRGRDTIVSVKSLARAAGEGGAVRRDEFEGPAYRPSPPIEWPPSAARSVVVEHVGGARLVDLVTVRQVRRVRLLRSAGTRVELSVDQVEIVAGDDVVDAFTDLEAELVRGDEAALAGLAERLAMEPGLRPEPSSKFATAMRAVAERGGRSSAADDQPREVEGPDATAEPGSSDVVDVPDATDVPDLTDVPDATDVPAAVNVPADASDAADVPAVPDEPDEAEAPDAAASMGLDEQAVPDGPVSAPSSATGVTADDPVAEAGRKVLRFHLGRMLEREAGVRAGLDVEDVHKMRVATRRQRAAWRVFGEAFRPRPTRPYRDGLRALARRLGTVRDLDVQLEAAEAYRSARSVDEPAALEPLLVAWRADREIARAALVEELDSDRYRRWVDAAGGLVLVEGGSVRAVGPTQPHHVRDTAPSRIWAAYEGVRAFEPVVPWADVPTLHELRIASKWLRYTIEFVQDALGDDAAELVSAVTALQDHLGQLQDADVTANLARRFLVDRVGTLTTGETAAIGRYLVDREREVLRLRRSVGPAWRGVASHEFRDALGRAVAAL
jgi:CHAD domain-containing protein